MSTSLARRILVHAAACIPASLGVVHAHAQTVPDAPACRTCEITTELAVRIDADQLPWPVRSVAELSDGRVIVVGTGSAPAVFAATGAYRGDIGRRGEGPGEMIRPTFVWVVDGDSVVIGNARGRANVHAPDLTFARAISLGIYNAQRAIALSWPDSMIVNADIETRERFGQPFHVMDMSGPIAAMTHSFGAVANEIVPRDESSTFMSYAMAPAADGGFWAGRAMQYDVTKWSPDLEPVRKVERRPVWFRRVASPGMGGPDTPPSPLLAGAAVDESGVLWTFTLIPSPDWRRTHERAAEFSGNEVSAGAIAFEYLYDTRVEAIDVAAGRVLASHTLDQQVVAILPGVKAAFAITDAAGRPSLRIIRLRLSR